MCALFSRHFFLKVSPTSTLATKHTFTTNARSLHPLLFFITTPHSPPPRAPHQKHRFSTGRQRFSLTHDHPSPRMTMHRIFKVGESGVTTPNSHTKNKIYLLRSSLNYVASSIPTKRMRHALHNRQLRGIRPPLEIENAGVLDEVLLTQTR